MPRPDRMSGMPLARVTSSAAWPRLPRWVAAGWALLWGLGLVAPSAVGLDRAHHPVLATVGLGCAVTLFVFTTVDATARSGTRRVDLWPVVAVQGALTVALATDQGLPWGTLPLLVAISVGTSVRLAWSPWLVVATAVAAAAVDHARGAGWGNAVLATGLTTLLAGMLTCAFSWLGQVIAELHRTRQELARTAVSSERLRFSRDLHDLLGHSLSVIAVKAQAARRAAPTDPDAAGRHARDIETLARDALTGVREAVQGYRSTSLDAEVTRASQALRAAGITTEVERDGDDLTPEQDDLLGWVVREGATNVLRHARASRALIRLTSDGSAATVVIEDDGAGPDVDEDRVDPTRGLAQLGGSGLAGLRERLTGSGGTLTTQDDGAGFRLTVRLPRAAGRARP